MPLHDHALSALTLIVGYCTSRCSPQIGESKTLEQENKQVCGPSTLSSINSYFFDTKVSIILTNIDFVKAYNKIPSHRSIKTVHVTLDYLHEDVDWVTRFKKFLFVRASCNLRFLSCCRNSLTSAGLSLPNSLGAISHGQKVFSIFKDFTKFM